MVPLTCIRYSSASPLKLERHSEVSTPASEEEEEECEDAPGLRDESEEHVRSSLDVRSAMGACRTRTSAGDFIREFVSQC